MQEKSLANLTLYEWAGVVLGALFLVPTALIMFGNGAFAENTPAGTATATQTAAQTETQKTQYAGDTNTLATRLPAPTHINAVPGECDTGKIKVQWAQVSDALKYRLFRGTTQIYQGTNLTFIDSGRMPYTEYHYSVAALHPQGPSPLISLSVLSPRECPDTAGGDNTAVDETGSADTTTASDQIPGVATTTTSTGVTHPLSVIPATTYLYVEQNIRFIVSQDGAWPMSWSVLEGVQGGVIDSHGSYRAPRTPGTFHVIAETSNPSFTKGRALVTVLPRQEAGTATTGGTNTYTTTGAGGTIVPAPGVATAPQSTAKPAPSPIQPILIAYPKDTVESLQTNEDIPAETEPNEGKSIERSLGSSLPADGTADLPPLVREKSKKLRVITELLESRDASDTFPVEAAFYTDSNSDGVSDYESEHVYGLAPDEPTPKSVYKGRRIGAAEKLLLGFDPAREELVSVVPEEPTVSPIDSTSAYNVNEVALTSENKVVLGGRALPNSFITIYIYSTPIVVTVKTNTEGDWSYTLDTELDDGTHTVYTATVDNSGKILAKSSGYLFTKTAQAATLEPGVLDSSSSSKPRLLDTGNLYLLLGALVAVLFIVFGVLGLSTKTNNNGAGPLI